MKPPFVYPYRIVLLLIGFVVFHSETGIPGCRPPVKWLWLRELLLISYLNLGSASMYNTAESLLLLIVDLITVSAAH